ncbi:hypothetical protein ACFE04_026250 [Oxalis oulophora]
MGINFVPIVILFHLFVLISKHGFVEGAEVPPVDATSEVLKKFLQLQDGIKFDLPAIYAFGDSYIDSGNERILNNVKPQLPYGIDFNHSTPTGRVTNGRTMLDFLVSGAGILPDTITPEKSKIMNLGEQVDNFERTLESLKSQFDGEESFNKYLSKSLFFINIATNDFGFTYKVKNDPKNPIPHEVYAGSLTEELSKQLERLHKIGARKFFLNNAIPMGNIPFVIGFLGQPDANLGKLVPLYNTRLGVDLQKLQSKLEGFQYTIGDLYKVIMDAIEKPSTYGFQNPMSPCLAPNKPLRSDRNDAVFFDIIHVTEAMHVLILKRYINEPSLVSPISPIKIIQA